MENSITNPCQHIATKQRDGETGYWCVDCGIKALEVESRECGDCKNCKTDFYGSYCSKKLMSLTPGLHVTFKVSEGTCFEV